MQAELLTTILEQFSAGTAAELYFQDETSSLMLRKASAGAAPSIGSPAPPPLPETPPPAPPPPKHSAGETIVSPIVATFYASAGPDSPSFVSAGTTVKKGDTLCILEAMKMMNHLEAEFDCEILRVFGKSGEMVEFGQPLFEVKRL